LTNDRMYCKIYSCHMSVAACITRQENARKYIESKAWGPGRIKPGALDVNCQNCKQGKKIMENQFRLDEDQGKDEHQGKDEPATQPAGKRPMMNEKDKGEPETRVCKEKDCEFGGEPQPIGSFQIHGPSQKPLGICKVCMGKKLKKGKQEKQKKRDEHSTSNEKTVTASSKADASGPLPPVPLDPKTYQYWPPDLLETLLDGLPEILKTIEETAHEQERTPIAQVRYFLKTDYRITGTDAE